MMFLCCHPRVAEEFPVAFMLNLLCRLRIATVFAVGLEYFFTEERT